MTETMTHFQIAAISAIRSDPNWVFPTSQSYGVNRMIEKGWINETATGYEVTFEGEVVFKESLLEQTRSRMIRIRFTKDTLATLCNGLRTFVKYYENQEIWVTGLKVLLPKNTQFYNLHLPGKQGYIAGVSRHNFDIIMSQREIV